MTPHPTYRVLPPLPLGDRGHQIRAVGSTATTAIGSVEVRPTAGGKMEIFNLHVAQPYRRQGVGRLLMNAAVQAASARRLTPFLEARPGDAGISTPALVAMYQRMGFRVVGTSPRGNVVMERRHGGPIPAAVPLQAKLAAPPPLRASVVQRMKKQKTMSVVKILPEEVILQIMSYLADLDLMRLAQVSQAFYNLVPRVFLSNITYTNDPKPIRPRGVKKTAITGVEHLNAAVSALRQAFRIRAFQPKTEIILYRVSEKETLTQTEKERYVVPGPFWTVEKTAAWILGGMLARVPFVLITPPDQESNFKEGNKKGRGKDKGAAIYAREILQLLSNGYTISTATSDERPYHYKKQDDLLILRPPQWSPGDKGTLATTRTKLNPSLWNRNTRDSSLLLAAVNGTPISAKMLHNFFALAMEDLKNLINMVSLCSSFESKFSKKHHLDDDDDDKKGGGGGNKKIKLLNN